jgi:hypothetical protein
MRDADDAQYNAVEQVLGAENNIKILMRFYHVAVKVCEKTKNLRPELYSAVAKGLSDLHFAMSESEFLATQQRVLHDWSTHPGLTSFTTYFTKIWIASRFWRWQICQHTPQQIACRELLRYHQTRLYVALAYEDRLPADPTESVLHQREHISEDVRTPASAGCHACPTC